MAQEKDMHELYAHMAEWHRFQRRDTDNIFNALFYDKENLATDEIMEFVQGTARFFDMPLPQVYDGCETFAKAVSRSMADYDICYNEKLLDGIGINNRDAFKLLMTHEVSHHVFRNVVFGSLANERWTHELVCDYMAGVRSVMCSFATGKYKYAIGASKPSLTHPPGLYRKKAFLHGCKAVEELRKSCGGLQHTDVLDGFKEFIIQSRPMIDDEWYSFLEHVDGPVPAPVETGIEDLPDSNLLKQLVLYGKIEL